MNSNQPYLHILCSILKELLQIVIINDFDFELSKDLEMCFIFTFDNIHVQGIRFSIYKRYSNVKILWNMLS